MLAVVNEWHRKVGIGFIMRAKLRNKIADTIAAKVFEEHLAQALREAAQSGAEEMRERAGLEEWQPIATAKDNVRYLVCNPAEGELIVMAMKRGDRWSDFAGRSVEPAPTHYCIRALPLPMNKTTQDA